KDLGTSAIKLPAVAGSAALISPDGRVGLVVPPFASVAAARAAESRKAVLFDTATGKELGNITLAVDKQLGFVALVAGTHDRPILFSPDSKLVAVNAVDDAREKIYLHDVRNGKRLRTFDAGPTALAGKGGGFGGGRRFGRFADCPSMLFSSDGKLLAFQPAAAAAITVLDTTTGKQVATLAPSETRPA